MERDDQMLGFLEVDRPYVETAEEAAIRTKRKYAYLLQNVVKPPDSRSVLNIQGKSAEKKMVLNMLKVKNVSL